METQNKTKPSLLIFIHVIGWSLVLLMPIFVDIGSEQVNWSEYFNRLIVPLGFLAIFYLNYFYLIDKYLFNRKVQKYTFINLLIITIFTIGLHFHHDSERKKRQNELSSFNTIQLEEAIESGEITGTDIQEFRDSGPKKEIRKFGPPPYPDTFFPGKRGRVHNGMAITFFFFRNLLSLLLVVGLAVAIKTTNRWYDDEAARNKLEKSKTEAELKNLKNQINPHFLLNTLNNIYALIAFDTNRAQEAVQELSKMLRYILYENQEEYVPINKEVDFIKNYIELMKIRLTPNVTVTTTFTVSRNSTTCIAPLIFISLIENSFKHGISPTEKSFIDISLEETADKKIICKITNSFYPKSESDKSGSGIGLEQVSKRLELLYKGRYIWNKGVSENGKEYSSLLVINSLETDKITA